MRLNSLILAATAASLVAAPVLAARQAPQEQLDKLLVGLTADKPVDCISQWRTNESQTIPGIGIVYKVGTTQYLNRFSDGCPQLDGDNILVTRTYGTQLCRGDIARVIMRGPDIETGSCIFGDFTPYRRMQ